MTTPSAIWRDNVHACRSFLHAGTFGPSTALARLRRSDGMTDKERANGSSQISKFFGDLANKTSLAAGRASTFMLAASVVVVWAVSGPLFGFSDTWQLVINTGTTIVTFLMVFLIQ